MEVQKERKSGNGHGRDSKEEQGEGDEAALAQLANNNPGRGKGKGKGNNPRVKTKGAKRQGRPWTRPGSVTSLVRASIALPNAAPKAALKAKARALPKSFRLMRKQTRPPGLLPHFHVFFLQIWKEVEILIQTWCELHSLKNSYVDLIVGCIDPD